jgi:hypothetical protein
MNPTPGSSPRPMIDAGLLLLGGIVVIMDPRQTIHAAEALSIRGGQSLAFGPLQDIARHYRKEEWSQISTPDGSAQ